MSGFSFFLKNAIREKRRQLILTVGLILIAVGVRLSIPTLIVRGTAYGSRYYLGLPVQIDNIGLSLLKGTILFEGVSVASFPDKVTPRDAALNLPPIDPSTALVHIQRVSVSFSWWALFKKTLRITELTIDAPSLRMLRDEGGKIDPLSHAMPLTQAPKEENLSKKSSSSPWTIKINSFALWTPNLLIVDSLNNQNLLDFSLESFNLDDFSACGSDLALGPLRIQGPVLRVQKDLVRANTPEVTTSAKSAMRTTVPYPTAHTDTSSVGCRIKKIDVTRAKFTWITKEKPLDVTLTLKASNVTADQGKRFPISLALQIENGSIGLDGVAGILPPSYSGKFTWNNLPFPPILLASRPELAAWLRSADCSGNLKIETDVAGVHGPPAIRFSGNSSISSLAIIDPGNKEFSFGWKQLDVVMNEAFIPIPNDAKSLPSTKLNFELIKLVEPKISYTHPPSALNALLGNSAPVSTPMVATPSNTPSTTAETSPVEAKISSLELSGGNIEFHNNTVTPTAISTISNLFVTARGISYPNPSMDLISIQATLPTTSTLAIDGSLNPGNIGNYSISLQNLDLPSFNQYAAAAGATLDAGQVSLTTKLKTQGALMQIDNDLVLRKFGISLRDPNSFARSFGVPIDLAIALLSDSSGNIKLAVPIRVDEKGSTVSTGVVLFSAIKASILGAVSTPLKLLGGSFTSKPGTNGSLLTIAPIKYPNGSTDIDSGAQERLNGLAKLLSQRLTMGLTLRGRTSLEDRPLIAEQLLIERVKEGKGLPELKGVGFLERLRVKQILTKRGNGKSAAVSVKDKPLFERYLGAVEIPDGRLDALANLRAEKVRDILCTKGVNTSRLQIGKRESEGEAGVVISFLPQKAAAGAK